MNQVQKFLTKLYRGAGGARARRCQSLLDRGLWDELTKEPSPDPRKYRYGDVLKRDRIVVDILRKCKLPEDVSSNDTYAEAVKTFYSCEAECESTNKRLLRLSNNAKDNYFASREDLAMWEFLLLWRKNISRFLGPLPKQLGLRFSSGATISHRSNEGTIPDKMSLPGSIYPESQDIYRHSVKNTCLDYLEDIPALEVITHNRFFTVPKDSSKDRGCCKEASASLQLQLDVGAVLKSIFRKRTGIDLRYAKPLHMELARQASAGQRMLSTIDLSNASDTVSNELVRLVLPTLWFDLLNSLRATHTFINGATVKLAKFSSMGNGFTFELETILFYTLCKTVDASREVYTFGDDIIVEQAVSGAVIDRLVYFGFTPNVNKTFCEGSFRESCGGDYFDGQAVRPHFMKEIPYEPQHWVVLANGLLRADPSLRWCRAAWRYAVDQVPSLWRNWVPSRFGDVGLHYPDGDREVPTAGVDPRYGPFYYGMVPVARRREIGTYEARVQYACALYGVGHTVTLRGAPEGYRRQRLYEIGHNDPGSIIPYLEQFKH